MRAFIAIDIPSAIRAEISNWQSSFRRLTARAKWTQPQGVHLTLKFLGEIDEGQAQKVTNALTALGTFTPFQIEIRGFGFFPDARQPRVFWAGVVAPPELADLARRVESSLEGIGFPSEKREFSPHLTLARFRDPRPSPELRAEAEKHADLVLGRFEVKEFYLYESRLHPQGAEYRHLARFPALPERQSGAT